MPLKPVMDAMAARCPTVRSGLAVGYGGAAAAEAFREARGGVWMSAETANDLPFEDRQFEVVAMDGRAVARENVREANRVLLPEGYLFFSVDERKGQNSGGFTAPEIYRIIREGFDIIELKLPKWWVFARRGRVITVCARKKAWREHKGLTRGGTVLLTPIRSRK